MAQSGYFGWISGQWWRGGLFARLFQPRGRRPAGQAGWRGVFGRESDERLERARIEAAPVAAPLGVRTAPAFSYKPSPRTAERLRKMRRRAAVDMFDQCGLGPFPGQFWRFVDSDVDPFVGVTQFLRAIGIDPDRVRRRDPQEIERANIVLELLFSIDHVFDRVAPEVAAELEARLCSGGYEQVRLAAGLIQTFERVAALEARWPQAMRLGVLNAFIADARAGMANPLAVSPGIAANAARVVEALSAQMNSLDTLMVMHDALVRRLAQYWPPSWRVGPELATREAALSAVAQAHRLLVGDAGLSYAAVAAQLQRIESANAQLQRLVDRIEERLGRSTGPAVAPQTEIERARAFFGIAPGARLDLPSLRKLYRALARTTHPDTVAGDPAAKAAAHRRFVELNRYYDVLRAAAG
ncbi:J domain-containing protein [Sphingomonas sp.]|uniref:J domain-containing protein n=1 Tax=Sphingomonas sp. TaxID=28214 RepID=UPI001E046399|nr:J domain-containing protein [Sphingomonas sp.]MBX9797597.1 J domain-containing protein [Sphingomonas sp.]